MKTLYISDLDGTLLNSEASLSEFTKETLNQLIQEGMLFTYATARSSISACAVTQGLNVKLPVIVYNGTFIKDLFNGEFLVSNYFGDEVKDLLDDLMEHDIYPIVYSYMNQEEKFTYLPERPFSRTTFPCFRFQKVFITVISVWTRTRMSPSLPSFTVTPSFPQKI